MAAMGSMFKLSPRKVRIVTSVGPSGYNSGCPVARPAAKARYTTMKAQPSTPVFVFACLVALLVLMGAYCTDRNGAVDEPGFLNPPYMLVHYGHLTFPTYPHNAFFDLPVITHPPVHTMWIGLLGRLGLPVYYAEATPTVLLLLVAMAIILS